MTTTVHAAAAATSNHLDSRTAATEIAQRVSDQLDAPASAAFLFASYHHAAAMAEARTTIQSMLGPDVHLLGVTAESVAGGTKNLQGRAGMSLLALNLPGAELVPFITTPEDPIRISAPDTIPERLGLRDDHRATFIFADPFTCPMPRLLPAMVGCRGTERPTMVVGGMASGAIRPGMNTLVCNDHVSHAGGVGLTINGGPTIDVLVSQGCKPIGQPLVITKVHEHTILELGGRKAFDALHEIAAELPEEERSSLSSGLLIGSVIDESRSHFGRGDFLIRNVMGYDRKVGAIKTGEQHRLGRTIQFHVRDGATAREDLSLLLDQQQLDAAPYAALLITCSGRGSRLFGDDDANYDVECIESRLNDPPLAGFYAAGEIAPIHGMSHLHGHTACIVMFRAPGGHS